MHRKSQTNWKLHQAEPNDSLKVLTIIGVTHQLLLCLFLCLFIFAGVNFCHGAWMVDGCMCQAQSEISADKLEEALGKTDFQAQLKNMKRQNMYKPHICQNMSKNVPVEIYRMD